MSDRPQPAVGSGDADSESGDENSEGTDRSGADAGPATTRLTVPEVDCASCARTVERSIEDLDGFDSADLRPTAGTVTARYDPERLSEADLVDAVEGAGYPVTDAATGNDDAGPATAVPDAAAVWTSRRALATAAGAVLLAAGLAVEFVLPALDAVVATLPGRTLHLADVLLLAAAATSGLPVLRSGYRAARRLRLDVDLLMATAIVAATGVGYYEEAATLAVLFGVAELLETYSMDRTRDSLRALLELSPAEATVVRRSDGKSTDGVASPESGAAASDEPTSRDERTLPVDAVHPGDVVAVRPGETVPTDGTVVAGASAVDESPITGESVPADKEPGDEVYAGTVNGTGYLEVAVTSEAGESTLARIVEQVRAAERERTDVEQFVDRFTRYYMPAVVALAVLTAAVPPVALGVPWRPWFVRGLTLLVIACPCALVISTPVSVVSGVTSAARNGVLVEGGPRLEAMGEVDVVAFDKTGTLTTGDLTVTDVVPVGDADAGDVLRVARAVEVRSEHPIAEAVVAEADRRGVPAVEPSDFESVTGGGVRATVDGEPCYAGTPDLLADYGVDLSAVRVAADTGPVTGDGSSTVTDGGSAPGDGGSAPDDGAPATGDGSSTTGEADPVDVRTAVVDPLAADGKTVVLVARGAHLLGVVAVADQVRPEAASAVARLREQGVAHTALLTGDNEGTARAVADAVGVDEYRAELLPDDKVAAVEALADEYGTVAMVGDGVNDAPALAAATVGVAMGAAGTDAAIETADVALLGDDLSKLPYLHALSRRARAVIRQNIWASLAVKALLAVGIPLGYVGVAVAVVVGDMGMSLGVTGNAMRLSRLRPASFTEE